MDVVNYAPDCNVVFYPYNQEDTLELDAEDALDLADWAPLHTRDDIIECSTSKPKGGTGSWAVLLSSRINYKALIHPGAWCMIYMSSGPLSGDEKSEKDSGLKMLGIVRSVRRKEVINEGTGERTARYLVAGEDFHGVFNTQIYINVNLADLGDGEQNPVAKSLLLFNKNFRATQMTPNEVVIALIDSLLGTPGFKGGDSVTVSKEGGSSGRTGQPYKIPSELSQTFLNDTLENNLFTELLTQFVDQNMLGTLQVTSDVSGTPTIWSVLQAYSHRILNEMYTDLLPLDVGNGQENLVPAFIYRPIPFSSSVITKDTDVGDFAIPFVDAGGETNRGFTASKRLRGSTQAGSRLAGKKRKDRQELLNVNRNGHFYVSHEIDENEILAFDHGKTDRERFNFFFVPSNLANTNVNEISLLKEIIAGGGLEEVGDPASIVRYGLRPYIAFSNFMVGNDTHVHRINTLVKDLWEQAHLFESGTVLLRGCDDPIPVGTNIKFVARNWLAHVEKVDHSFTVEAESSKKHFRTSVTFVRLQTLNGEGIDEIGTDTDHDGRIGDFDRGMRSSLPKDVE